MSEETKSVDVAAALSAARLVTSGDLSAICADARAAFLEATARLDGVAEFLIGYGEEAEIASRAIRKQLAHMGVGEAPR